MSRLVTLAGVFGAAALVAASPIIDSDHGKVLAMFGLVLLGFQAYTLRAWNLVILNAASFLGYGYALYI
ncbi:MAG: hypothetical protein VW496_05005 [Pelagibacteraceae bacterium]